jgi:hypothetical protein
MPMTLINSSDIVFFMKVFLLGAVKTKRRELQMPDLVSEDLKEREEVLISGIIITQIRNHCWSELLTPVLLCNPGSFPNAA